jgi:hypothetical protein
MLCKELLKLFLRSNISVAFILVAGQNMFARNNN